MIHIGIGVYVMRLVGFGVPEFYRIFYMRSVEGSFDRVPGSVSVVFVNKVPSSVAARKLWIPAN